VSVFILLLLFANSNRIAERKYYKGEVERREKVLAEQASVIKEQHSKLCMLSGILSQEYPKFKLEWVDLSCP
jgi:hypothetical protein